MEGMAIHSFNRCPKAPHGPQIQCCNVRRRIRKHQIILKQQTSFEDAEVPNPAQAAKSELSVAVKWGEGASIPSIDVQRLPMGPKYNVATCVEELGSTKSYWRSKRLSKTVEVPNPAQAAKLELLVAAKWKERPSIPSIYAQRLPMGPKYNVATCIEELGSTKSYWRSKRLSKRVKITNLAQAAKLELLVAVKWRERSSF